MIVYVIAGYVLLNVYFLFCIWRWLRLLLGGKFHKGWKAALIGAYGMLAASGPVAYFMHRAAQGRPRKNDRVRASIQRFNNRWMGIWIYSLLYAVIMDIALLASKAFGKKKRTPEMQKKGAIMIGIAYTATVLSAALYGIRHVKKIYVNPKQILISKKVPGISRLRVVLVADLHLGYSIGAEQMTTMVKKINQCQPDIVIFAGDIFDNSYDAISQPEKIEKILRKIRSKKGVYAVYGNHDIDEKLFCGFSVQKKSEVKRDPREDIFLVNANICPLQDEVISIDDAIYLVGRKDAEKTGDGINKRKPIGELMKNLDRRKPIFLIDHQPSEMEEAEQEGVDVQFSGHTHAGQFFPLTLSSRFLWKNPWGMVKKGNMYSIVTSGVGIYGPDMRAGTNSEIMDIMIRFEG